MSVPLPNLSANAHSHDAHDQLSDDQVWDKCKQQRDDERLVRIERPEYEGLVDYVHRQSQKDDSSARVQSVPQPSNAFLRIAHHRHEIWGTA
jgi:hypothetical protein